MKILADKSIDEQAWLDARKNAVTATDIRDLYIGKKTFETLAHEKVHGSKFTGNQYTEWGKIREEVIARIMINDHKISKLQSVSWVAASSENERFFASPDLFGEIDGDLRRVGEIKTSKYDATPGSDYYKKCGYEYQMQWQMMVCEASACYYYSEDRLETHNGFIAGFLEKNLIPRDEAVIEKLVKLANDFLTFFDDYRQQAKEYELDEMLIYAKAKEYEEAIKEEKKLTERKKQLHQELCESFGDRMFKSSIFGLKLSFSPAAERRITEEILQLEEARKADPHLYASLDKLNKLRVEHEKNYTKTVNKTVTKKESLRITS